MKILLALLALFLPACSPAALAALAGGAQTAIDVAHAGCALLGSAQTPTDALERLAQIEQQIVEAQIEAAAQRGADRALLDAARDVLAATKAAQRQAYAPIGQAAGDAPVKIAPCPVAAPTAVPPPSATP